MGIQSKMKELFGNACCGYCYAYVFGKDKSTKGLTRAFLNGWINGYIDDDGFVSRPVQYINSMDPINYNYKDVMKVDIKRLRDLPDGLWVVLYEYGDHKTHFVVATNKSIEFDPGDGVAVSTGHVVSYRAVM